MKFVELHETEAVFQTNRKSVNGFGTYRPAAISRSIPGDIPDPLVFAVMQHHPRNLAHLVQTGTGVNHKNRKMKEECAK